MQRVFRSSLVSLLTIAGLAACGDKVTPVVIPTPTPGTVVHAVVVTPPTSTIQFGGSIILAAAVDADAGVTVRTVTWSSSDATVATVDATGKVSAAKPDKAGTVSIKAAATADATVSGAALVTVQPSVSSAPTVTISSVNNTVCGANGCTSTPVPVAGAAGQLDVILNVEANGQVLRSVQATLKCGNDSLTQTQTVGDVAPVAAEAAASPVTISIPTNQFNPANGVPALHNGACTISASATTAGGVQSATNSQPITLNNPDAVIVSSVFVAPNNLSATDANGIGWKSGALTVTAIPVVYTPNRTVSTVTVTLPNAQGLSKNFLITTPTTPGVWTATFANTAGTQATRVGQVTLTGPIDANGFPTAITPTVLAIDAAGNDVALVSLGTQTPFRLDNQSPAAPTTNHIPIRQAGWINATYVFSGVGAGANSAAGGLQGTNYQSNGDGLTSGFAGVGGPSPAPSASGLTTGNTLTYFYKLATGYTAADNLVDGNGATIGTAVGIVGAVGQCTTTTTGWTQINTGNDIPATLSNLINVARILETDKLGNIRCTDLGDNVGATTFFQQKFGVDKLAPIAAFVDSSAANPTAANANMKIRVGASPNFIVGLSDDASGFSATPLTATLIRLAIDPNTGVASTPSTAFGCVRGSGTGCTPVAISSNTPADGGSGNDLAGCTGCGYFTLSPTALDQARNSTVVPPRTVLIDRLAPTMGSIAVPATVNPGTSTGGVFFPAVPSAAFSTSATDNLDLINYDYTLTYATSPVGNPAGIFAIRSPSTATAQILGVAFDNTLTTTSAFSLAVPTFIRSLSVTAAGDGPPNSPTGGTLPSTIAARVNDAAANPSLVNPATGAGFSNIPPASINNTNPTNFFVAPAGQNPGANMTKFVETNPAVSISNCPAAGCAGGAAAANATTVTQFTAAVSGNEAASFQFTNPFSQVQFYYFDNSPGVGEYILIGTAVAPVVTDDTSVPGAFIRTFTYTLNTTFDPPATMAVGPLNLVAVGVNASGDALATRVNVATTLTNP